MNRSVLSSRLNSDSLSLEQLNDILLLVNQFPLGRAFFDFFLARGKTDITFKELKAGIARFEGLAILCFGNIRFPYRTCYKSEEHEIAQKLERFQYTKSTLVKKYRERPSVSPLPAKIPGKKTWLLGYIARAGADRDIATYFAMSGLLKKESEGRFLGELNPAQKKLYLERKLQLQSSRKIWRNRFSDLSKIRNEIDALRKDLMENRIRGWLNTSHYLSSDFMDVYVATSMREKWEFEDVHAFASNLFKKRELSNLRLRYFDPTQSHLDNRVDKGLIEALMLKRADCTLYMVQETDTFGKDSELATTLAQGKPVIAYVPRIDREKLAEVAAKRPLGYLKKRLNQLSAEERIPASNLTEVYHFLEKVSAFQPFYRIVGDEENEFVDMHRLTKKKVAMCKILAEAENRSFESRAETLQKRHPLALQVRLESGVANGVLVVRSLDDCADLLRMLVTNDCSFTVDRSTEKGVTALVEDKSQGIFRAVTDNPTITNSFWSMYLTRT